MTLRDYSMTRTISATADLLVIFAASKLRLSIIFNR